MPESRLLLTTDLQVVNVELERKLQYMNLHLQEAQDACVHTLAALGRM